MLLLLCCSAENTSYLREGERERERENPNNGGDESNEERADDGGLKMAHVIRSEMMSPINWKGLRSLAATVNKHENRCLFLVVEGIIVVPQNGKCDTMGQNDARTARIYQWSTAIAILIMKRPIASNYLLPHLRERVKLC